MVPMRHPIDTPDWVPPNAGDLDIWAFDAKKKAQLPGNQAPNNSSYVYYNSDGFAFIISEEPSGYLKCNDCNDVWCQHLEDSIKHHEDSAVLFHRVNQDSTRTVQVPIYPTGNLWCEVQVEPSAIPGALTVWRGKQPLSDGPWVGFINPGDGRLVMRQMILDAFDAEVEANLHSNTTHPTTKCPAMGHSYQREQYLRQNMLRDSTQLFELWCIQEHGACLACWSATTGWDKQDISDLVPDDEKPKWSKDA